MTVRGRAVCIAVCAALITTPVFAVSGKTSRIDGYAPSSVGVLPCGSTLAYYDLSDTACDTSGGERTSSRYGGQDFSVVEFDPAERELYLDYIPAGDALGELATVSDTVRGFAESAPDGKQPAAAINAGGVTESYLLSRDRDIATDGELLRQNVKKSIALPCGYTVSGGEILCGAQTEAEQPYTPRYSFGVTRDRVPFLALPKLSITVSGSEHGATFTTDALNRLPSENTVVVYTDRGPICNQSLDDAYELVIDCGDYTVCHGAKLVGTVTDICSRGDADPLMRAGRIILTARGDAFDKLSGYSIGETVTVSIEVTDALGRCDEQLRNAETASGGALPLVIDGVTCAYENRMLTDRLSASVVGYTENGKVKLVSLDSRKDNNSERCFSIVQMSDIAIELGLVNALLLDSGSSTSMVMSDADGFSTVNLPNDGGEAAVAGTLVLSRGRSGMTQGNFDIPQLVRYDENISVLRFSDTELLKYVRTGDGGIIGTDGDSLYDAASGTLVQRTENAVSLRCMYAKNGIDLSEYRFITVTYSTASRDVDDESAHLTARVLPAGSAEYLPESGIELALIADGSFHSAAVDLSAYPAAGGMLDELRLVLTGDGSDVRIASVAFWKTLSGAELGGARLASEANGGPYIPLGDVNGDGTSDVKDIVRLMKRISGSNVIATHTDINGDGVLDVRDLIRLMKIVSGQVQP